jgi:DHA2 family metal-tetracycline-proton antiporter-like MFS transporter
MNPRKLVPWVVYLIFFAVLNETMFNVSTPMIAHQFSLTSSGVSWMTTIFMVFFGIGSVIYGKLADIYDLRRLIIIGVLLYVGGSLMGFALQFSYPLVVAARAIQGMGGSAIPALVFVVAARYFEPSHRGRVFGIITSTVSLAIGFGPVIGGFVSARFSWSYLFLIPVLVPVALPFLARELPREPRRQGSVDVIGAVLVALDLGALVVYLNFFAWYALAAFVVLLGLFILRIFTAADPFIKPSLFRNARFRSGVIVGFALFFCVLGFLFLIPLMLNEIHGLNPSQIGLLLFPGAISSVIFGPIAGRLADRRGNSFVVAIGLALLVASLLVISFLLSFSAIIISAALLLNYVGFSLFQTAMANSVSLTLPAEETGVGMGLFNLAGTMAGAIGTTVVGRLLAGSWLNARILALPTVSSGFAYSNLILALAVIVILGGALYLRAYRGMAAVKPTERGVSEA